MKKKLKKIPNLKNDAEEFEFWSKHDLIDHLDLSQAKQVNFPNLKLTLETK